MKKWITFFCKTCFLLLTQFFPGPGVAQKSFDFNANCQQAYREIIQLKLSSGSKMLEIEKKTNPDNLIPYFLENYIDFFVLFFNEDPAVYKLKEANESKRLQLMEKGPESSPYYLFSQSVIHFQWAAVKIKFGNKWDAGWTFRRSFLDGKENQEKFPAFSPSAMLNGAMQVTAGTIPDGYRWLSNLLGIKGSIKRGMQGMEQFLAKKDPLAALYREEAVFYYLYLKFYIENQKDAVFTFLEQNKLDLVNNHLFVYLAANLGINGQRSEYAKNILLQKNNSQEYLEMPQWDLEMGYAKLNHLEPDADIFLNRFLEKFRGRFYVKDVLQKLSWFYYLQGDQSKANAYRELVLKRGNLDTEADKQAQKEAEEGNWPNKLLLKVRLLNDGGYNTEALNLLLANSSAGILFPADKLEFAYRLGRLYDDTGKIEEAVNAYARAIRLGSQSRAYYAARAALQTGYIYEKSGDKKKASIYFQKCIDMKDHDYKNSLDQKAKAGLQRCKREE
jgi:hypothetical protein